MYAYSHEDANKCIKSHVGSISLPHTPLPPSLPPSQVIKAYFKKIKHAPLKQTWRSSLSLFNCTMMV